MKEVKEMLKGIEDGPDGAIAVLALWRPDGTSEGSVWSKGPHVDLKRAKEALLHVLDAHLDDGMEIN